MKAKVSVIIPVYNAGLYLERCVQSLFSQTLKDIEYIFVDDCSTDESMQVLKNMLEQYPDQRNKVKVVRHEENRGVAATRNTGLENATGEYIGWVDADDYVDEKMFEELYQTTLTNSADLVWSDYYVVYEEHKVEVSQKNSPESLACIRSLITGRLMGALWTKLMKKELFVQNDIKFVEGQNMAEDLRVSVQLFYYSKKNVYLPKSYYFYDKSGTATMSFQNTHKACINIEWWNNVKDILHFLEEKSLNKDLKTEMNLLKLSPKKNLLIRGRSVESFKEWAQIFPESNSYVWKTNLPSYYKVLAWCSDKKIWPVVRLWLFVKYRLAQR